MLDASCQREDIIAAYEDLSRRIAERRAMLWSAYREATDSMSRREYDQHENECWSVLRAGLAGLDAEDRILRRDFDQRMQLFDEPGAVAGSA